MHQIQKQILDFKFSDRQQASNWQQRIYSQMQPDFEAQITAVLDGFAKDELWTIDRIELQLGNLSENELARKIGEELQKELQRKANGALRASSEQRKNKKIDQNIRKTEARIASLPALAHFLKTGFFPWNTPTRSLLQLEKILIKDVGIKAVSMFLKKQNVLQTKWSRARLYNQFSKTFATGILKAHYKNSFRLLKQIQTLFNTKVSGQLKNSKRQESSDLGKVEIIPWMALQAPENIADWPHSFSLLLFNAVFDKAENKTRTHGAGYLEVSRIAGNNAEEILAYLKEILEQGIFKESEIFGPSTFSAPDTDGKTGSTKQSPEKIPQESVVDADIETANLKQKNKDSADKYSHKEHEENEQGAQDDEHEIEVPRVTDNISDTPEWGGNMEQSAAGSEQNSVADKHTADDDISGKDAKHGKNKQRDITNQQSKSQKSHEKGREHLKLSPEEVRSDTFKVDKEEGNAEPDRYARDSSPEKEKHDKKESGPRRKFQPAPEVVSEPEKYIQNSGLVLTWPYLFRLFDHLGYLKNKSFENDSQQERAVLLLGYLATGNPVNGEHLLVLPKLMCGWPQLKPVVKDVALTVLEKKEADEMLQVLIAHWKILKKTSIEGLRETFIARQGRLTEEEDQWKLIVEQRGTDVLLDHLPFGISLIKLPWLKKMIKVDWA